MGGSPLPSPIETGRCAAWCAIASRARELADRGFELHEGDVLDPEALRGAGRGVEVAYYLIHSMGRGAAGDFEERERQGARNFAEMAKREGVGRVVYLGGLGDRPQSKHLRSRRRTAQILSELGPPLTYFRAGMIVGAGSESYRTLRYLVQRLPAMIGPAWLGQPTQPIGIDEVIAYLAAAPDVAASEGREVQIGGPDVLSYGEMLDLMADALGVRRRPRVPVPLITPWLSSLWIGLVTPVDPGVARPLIEGLSTPTVVTDGSGAEPCSTSGRSRSWTRFDRHSPRTQRSTPRPKADRLPAVSSVTHFWGQGCRGAGRRLAIPPSRRLTGAVAKGGEASREVQLERGIGRLAGEVVQLIGVRVQVVKLPLPVPVLHIHEPIGRTDG